MRPEINTHNIAEYQGRQYACYDYNITDMIDCMRVCIAERRWPKYVAKQEENGVVDTDWLGCSYEKAWDQISGKSPIEVKTNANELQDSLTHAGVANIPDIEHNVYGHYPDVGEFISGNPECMCNIVPRYRDNLIAVAISINASSGFSAESLRKRGEILVGLIKSLENSGYQVRVDLILHNSLCNHDTKFGLIRYNVKDYQDPGDADLNHWIFGTPQALRIGAFMHGDYAGNSFRELASSRYPKGMKVSPFYKQTKGVPTPISKELLSHFYGTEYDLVISGLSLRNCSMSDLQKSVEKFYAKKC